MSSSEPRSVCGAEGVPFSNCCSIRPSRPRICRSNSFTVEESDGIDSSRSSLAPELAVDGLYCPGHASEEGPSMPRSPSQQNRRSPASHSDSTSRPS
jgi:hypothetical protein